MPCVRASAAEDPAFRGVQCTLNIEAQKSFRWCDVEPHYSPLLAFVKLGLELKNRFEPRRRDHNQSSLDAADRINI
ncbi:hypothetical protein TNCV_1987251 [Trichonephila clavipes]|nr:hypothetical protein TNCV_1987251 [Trichonephila clavipes]